MFSQSSFCFHFCGCLLGRVEPSLSRAEPLRACCGPEPGNAAGEALSVLSAGVEMGLGRRSRSSPLAPGLVQAGITLPLLTFKTFSSIL